VLYALAFFALVGTQYNNIVFIGKHQSIHPEHGLPDAFNEMVPAGMATPWGRWILTQLFVLTNTAMVVLKVESRRNSLKGFRLYTVIAYFVAVAAAFPVFLARAFYSAKEEGGAGSAASSHHFGEDPLHDGKTGRGHFNFKLIFFFTAFNSIVVALLNTLSTFPPLVAQLYFGMMVVYLLLPWHSGEKDGRFHPRSIRHASWLYGLCAGTALILSVMRVADLANSGVHGSPVELLQQVLSNGASRSFFIDYAALTAAIAVFVITDHRIRDDRGSPLRYVLLLVLFFLPSVSFPLYLCHREAVNAEADEDKYGKLE